MQFDVVILVDRVCRGWVSNSASAPTLARPGNGCFETAAGLRVVGSSERESMVLDEMDDVDWTGGGHSCSREVAQVVLAARRHGPAGA